jgi:polar amino acid transport system substrate-binding protein
MLNSSLAQKQWEELRTRINSGPGADAQAVLRESLASFPGQLENILRGSQRIDGIVKRLKNYYKKDSSVGKQAVRINEVIEKAVEILDAKIRKSTVHFVFHPGERLPEVLGNFQELEQVAINLIENSCQALRDTGGSVTVRTSLGPDNQVCLRVEDTGVGIPKEDLERIMDPFFTTKRETGGTGLGLSLAYSIVNYHGGQMRFESEPGAGTVATVLLPPHSRPS